MAVPIHLRGSCAGLVCFVTAIVESRMPLRRPSSIDFERFRLGLEKATGVPIRLRVTVVKADLTEVAPKDRSEVRREEKRAIEANGG